MIKKINIFNVSNKKYKLVTVRKYEGCEAYFQTWTFLSYAVVEDIGNNSALCFRDKNVMYKYMPVLEKNNNKLRYDYADIKKGDIRIFNADDENFSKISNDIQSINNYMKNSGLYFEDDTKYGVKLKINK